LSTAGSAFHSFAELGFDHAGFLRTVVAATLSSQEMLVSSPARTQPRAS
jgi:hypothetical protein